MIGQGAKTPVVQEEVKYQRPTYQTVEGILPALVSVAGGGMQSNPPATTVGGEGHEVAITWSVIPTPVELVHASILFLRKKFNQNSYNKPNNFFSSKIVLKMNYYSIRSL